MELVLKYHSQLHHNKMIEFNQTISVTWRKIVLDYYSIV